MSAHWTQAYYATGKRVTVDGVPAWRPKWWNTLGNDKEALAAIRPHHNPTHYAGYYRVVRDGIPYRFAPWVKTLKPATRAQLCTGSDPFGLTLESHPKGQWEAPTTKAFRARYGEKEWKLSWKRREVEYHWERNRWTPPLDLFGWARQERRRARAQERRVPQ